PDACRICREILEARSRCPKSRCRLGANNRLARKSKRCRNAPKWAALAGRIQAAPENPRASGPRRRASGRSRREWHAETTSARAELPKFGGGGRASRRLPVSAMKKKPRRLLDRSKRCRTEIA